MTAQAVYAYYPGCSLHSSAREYEVSTQMVAKTLGIQLVELEDWTCCGASSAHSISYLLSLALPARNLAIAQKMGLTLTTPCAMCFSRMKFAVHELAKEGNRELVSAAMGREYSNTTPVEHLLKVLSIDVSPWVKRPLEGLKVACYYGCLLVRPQEVTQFDDEENPQVMDRLIEGLGAQTLDWGLKVDCCGASMPFARPDVVLRLSQRILAQAKRCGADCLAVACPMCHSNLDTRQRAMAAKYGEIDLPVLYFTQLMGLAFGYSAKALLLHKHLTDPLPMLRAKGLA